MAKGDPRYDKSYARYGASVNVTDDDNGYVIPLFVPASIGPNGVVPRRNLKNVITEDTTTLLNNGGVMTGMTWDFGADPSLWPNVFAARAYSDKAGTLYLEQSNNGATGWRYSDSDFGGLIANKVLNAQTRIFCRYARVRYVNGALAGLQTIFEINSGAFDS